MVYQAKAGLSVRSVPFLEVTPTSVAASVKGSYEAQSHYVGLSPIR